MIKQNSLLQENAEFFFVFKSAQINMHKGVLDTTTNVLDTTTLINFYFMEKN